MKKTRDIDLGGFVVKEEIGTAFVDPSAERTLKLMSMSPSEKQFIFDQVLRESGAEKQTTGVEFWGGETVKFSRVTYFDGERSMSIVYDLDGRPMKKSFSVNEKGEYPRIVGGPEWSIIPSGERASMDKVSPI